MWCAFALLLWWVDVSAGLFGFGLMGVIIFVQLRDDIQEYAKILVVGAGGLGCELLKDLALSGFKNIDVIGMDRIEVSNLNRQFLFRLEDVGKPKAVVAAKRVMERVSGVNIVPHFCRIEDKDLDFYSDFNIIVLGLDSIEARSYINAVACNFLGMCFLVAETSYPCHAPQQEPRFRAPVLENSKKHVLV
ncbi:NEDD8-activating enzyme E1 catalytic subunit [Dionaea muscipula]